MGKSRTMIIYTDGSCHGNPGKGGWALYCPETGLENWGSDERTTNNRMELTAIVHALQVPGVTKIITDSDYCYKGCTKWIKGWTKKGWKTAAGGAVKNDDLWKKIEELDPDRVAFEWVKAHVGSEPSKDHQHNNHVDKLANNAIDMTDTPEQTKSKLEQELEILDKRREEIMQKLKDLEM